MNKSHPKPPFREQQQPVPGYTDQMDPRPDHGEESYKGSGKLAGKVALITGADSGHWKSGCDCFRSGRCRRADFLS